MWTPWSSGLPTRLEVGGAEYEIRSDYRAVLDICAALSAPELDGQERSAAALVIFYPGLTDMPAQLYKEALERCCWFINGGNAPESRKAPKLVDWKQDYNYIVSPINRVIGKEIRAIPYDFETNTGGLHWWTFLAAYQEIGDCTFAQIVRIRDHLNRGKRLDKADQEWYQRNRHLVDIKNEFTAQEEEEYSDWLR